MVNATNIIIDCDAGVDDALALYLLLTAHKQDRLCIEAVTCVFGNTSVRNVVSNVFRVLQLFEDLNIPVYRGAYSPLLSSKGFLQADKEHYQGLDGFGDVYTNELDTSTMRKAHAAYALYKHISDNPNNISLICLGPLTNIALAIKLYPDFACSIKHIFIMGGNCTGRGNIKSHAEFNFYCDPESASIVLNNVYKPIYMLPWETCLKCRITYDWRTNILGVIDTPFVHMLNKIEDGCQRIRKGIKPQYYMPCDAILAGFVLRPEMAKRIYLRFADVELIGSKTRGQVVIDHQQEQKTNIYLIDEFDSEMLKDLIYFAVSPDEKNNEVLFPQIVSSGISLIETFEESQDEEELWNYKIEENNMDLMALVPDFKTVPNSRVREYFSRCYIEIIALILIPGSSAWSKLRRWFLSTQIVSRKHPFTQWCLKSNKALQYEISRHIQSYPYMIHPFSSFRLVYWFACLEYYLPLIVAKVAGADDESWIRSSYMLTRKTRFRIYLACLHRALIALAGSAHYLNMNTTEDIVYNLILTILGFLGFVYLLARFSQLLTTFHSTSKRHLKLMQQLQQYMRHKELPYLLQRRLLTYYNYRNRKGLERDKRIMKYVSPYLREKLLLHNYMKLLNKVELFRHLPQIAVTQLADTLRSEIFITNDVLIRAGTRGDALYIIASGTVAVFNNAGKEICHLEDGAYFGEIALVMEDEWRIANVVAMENCEVYILSRVNFQRVLTPYPDLLNHLQNVALTFLEQTLPLEEACKLDSSALASVKINISSIKTKRKD